MNSEMSEVPKKEIPSRQRALQHKCCSRQTTSTSLRTTSRRAANEYSPDLNPYMTTVAIMNKAVEKLPKKAPDEPYALLKRVLG